MIFRVVTWFRKSPDRADEPEVEPGGDSLGRTVFRVGAVEEMPSSGLKDAGPRGSDSGCMALTAKVRIGPNATLGGIFQSRDGAVQTVLLDGRSFSFLLRMSKYGLMPKC